MLHKWWGRSHNAVSPLHQLPRMQGGQTWKWETASQGIDSSAWQAVEQEFQEMGKVIQGQNLNFWEFYFRASDHSEAVVERKWTWESCQDSVLALLLSIYVTLSMFINLSLNFTSILSNGEKSSTFFIKL